MFQLCTGGSVTDLVQGLKCRAESLTEDQIAYIIRETVEVTYDRFSITNEGRKLSPEKQMTWIHFIVVWVWTDTWKTDGRMDSMKLRTSNNVKHVINYCSEIKLCSVYFRRFRRISKYNNFVMSLFVSSWNNSALTRRIFTKLDIWVTVDRYASFIKIWQE